MGTVKRSTFIIIAFLAACSGEPTMSAPPEDVAEPAREFLERLVPRFDELAVRRLHSLSVESALRSELEGEAKRSWSARLDGGIKYADLLVDLYRERDWTLYFAEPSGLNDRGHKLLQRLLNSDQELLDPHDYHVDLIRSHDAELADAVGPVAPSFVLTGEEAELAVRWLRTETSSEIVDEENLERRLVDAMLGVGEEESAISHRLHELQLDYHATLRADVRRIAALEARVVDGALRLARDLRHGNYRRLSWSELAHRGGGKAVVYDRLADTFADVTTASAVEVDVVIDDLRPPHEQYERLLEARQQYLAIVDAGGWPQVSPFELRVGTVDARAAALRERLKSEGYLPSSVGHDVPDDVVTETLLAAVEHYQTTHQFRPGTPTSGFWRSLNVPAQRRLAEIELTIRRWRDSYFRGEQDFVFVNIPDFHAEVWRDGERRMRFRVVVGNNDRTCDPESKTWHYPNATPVQWATLDHIMVNPWWNVPPRIYEEEIAPHIEEPGWLEEKQYELWMDGEEQRARQRPGETNALGLVKFIFPNEHNTYMHDTPHKKYFDYPVRAFSHGCVRVHEPLKLAEYFMTEYGMGGKKRLDRILELGSTIELKFDEEIPVFFEYYVVRVDADGHVHFLADPYSVYKEALAEDPAAITSCEISPTPDPDEEPDKEPDGGPDISVPEEVAVDHGP